MIPHQATPRSLVAATPMGADAPISGKLQSVPALRAETAGDAYRCIGIAWKAFDGGGNQDLCAERRLQHVCVGDKTIIECRGRES